MQRLLTNHEVSVLLMRDAIWTLEKCARVPENPRMTYSAYLKALRVREKLERERKKTQQEAAAKARAADRNRRSTL